MVADNSDKHLSAALHLVV